MRHILFATLLVTLVACAKEVPVERVEIRQGLVYEVNSQKPFSGRSVSYWPNGQLKEKSTFKNGELNGPYELYRADGQVLIKLNYSKETAKKIVRDLFKKD